MVKKPTDIENKLTVTKGERRGEMNWYKYIIGTNIYTLLHIK